MGENERGEQQHAEGRKEEGREDIVWRKSVCMRVCVLCVRRGSEGRFRGGGSRYIFLRPLLLPMTALVYYTRGLVDPVCVWIARKSDAGSLCVSPVMGYFVNEGRDKGRARMSF